MNSKISLIIPTYNRATILKELLEALKNQTLPLDEYEIIIVDNNSSDNTNEVANSFKNFFPSLKVIFEKNPGLHNGRHAGYINANSEILVYADDDIEPKKTWLESIYDAFQDLNVSMVGGNNFPLYQEKPPKWILSLWKKGIFSSYQSIPALSIINFFGPDREISPHLVWGCNFSVRKSVIKDAGGFHPDGMPKDKIVYRGDGESYISSFVEQSNKKCVFISGASVFHKIPAERMTFEYFKQRGFNQGISQSFRDLREPKNIKYKSIISRINNKINLLIKSKEAKHAIKEMRLGFSQGYAFHQDAYFKSKKLQEWVHKKDFL